MEAQKAQIVVFAWMRLLREGLALSLDREDDLIVFGRAETPDELIAIVNHDRLDAIVVMLDEVEPDTITLLLGLRDAHPDLAIVALERVTFPSRVLERFRDADIAMLEMRANGLPEVCAMVRALVHGRDQREVVQSIDTGRERPLMTRREHDVLQLIGTGRTAAEISAELGIQPKTVENHKQRIFRKLDVQSQTHAVARAIQMGLIGTADHVAGLRATSA